jgi:hypothetical protein
MNISTNTVNYTVYKINVIQENILPWQLHHYKCMSNNYLSDSRYFIQNVCGMHVYKRETGS